MEEAKYCLSAKQLLQCGTGMGIEQNPDGSLVLTKDTGFYLSDVYDSGKTDMIWNQLNLTIKYSNLYTVYILLFNMESDESAGINQEDLTKQFKEIKKSASIISNYRDILLFGKGDEYKGRYLRFAVEFFKRGRKNIICLEGFEVSFPKYVFTGYLPNIYQENYFLERFLSIFQTLYLETEHDIDTYPATLDCETADVRQLHKLAAWIGISKEEYGIDYESGFLEGNYKEETLRNLVKNGTWLSKHKGTREYYIKLIQWITGEIPIFRDCHESDSDNVFRVLLTKNHSTKTLDYLKEVLDHTKPFDAMFHIVLLHSKYGLDEENYLGINSYLL